MSRCKRKGVDVDAGDAGGGDDAEVECGEGRRVVVVIVVVVVLVLVVGGGR